MVSDSVLIRRIRQFKDIMNANMGSSTLYHGLEDILEGKKPMFYLDNDIEFVDIKEQRSQ